MIEPRAVPPTPTPDAAALAIEIGAVAKYRSIDPDTLLRAARLGVKAFPGKSGLASKHARSKLHQWTGAYRAGDVGRLSRDLERIDAGDAAALRALAERALAAHASTAERISEMRAIYPPLFAATGSPTSVADLCGGAHAFALPFMGLASDREYVAFDVDGEWTDLAGSFIAKRGQRGGAVRRDVIARPPEDPFDVALLLKSAPCLERQEEGATKRLLRALRCRVAVLSFPTRSLGGRDRGMVDHYRQFALDLARRLRCARSEVAFASETFHLYALDRAP